MVRRLGAGLHLAQPHMGALGRLGQDLFEQVLGEEPGAGAGGQVPAVPQQAHTSDVDVPVALHRVLHRGAGLGKGGRVEDDDIVPLPLPLELGQQVEHIGAEEGHPVRKAVEGGVALRLVEGRPGGIHPEDAGRPGDAGVEGEGAGVGEAVQHLCPPAEGLDGQAVELLVEEEAGLLPLGHIDQVADAVFHDLHLGGEFPAEEAVRRRKPLPGPLPGVAALIDAPDCDAVGGEDLQQQVDDGALEPLHPHRGGLQHQHLAELVHHQPGEEVRLAEDEPAAGGVDHPLAVVPGGLHPPPEEGGVDLLVEAPGEHPQPEPGAAVVEPPAEGVAVKVPQGDDVAVRRIPFDPVDLVVVDPGAPGLEGGAGVFFQKGCGQFQWYRSFAGKIRRRTSSRPPRTSPPRRFRRRRAPRRRR